MLNTVKAAAIEMADVRNQKWAKSLKDSKLPELRTFCRSHHDIAVSGDRRKKEAWFAAMVRAGWVEEEFHRNFFEKDCVGELNEGAVGVKVSPRISRKEKRRKAKKTAREAALRQNGGNKSQKHVPTTNGVGDHGKLVAAINGASDHGKSVVAMNDAGKIAKPPRPPKILVTRKDFETASKADLEKVMDDHDLKLPPKADDSRVACWNILMAAGVIPPWLVTREDFDTATLEQLASTAGHHRLKLQASADRENPAVWRNMFLEAGIMPPKEKEHGDTFSPGGGLAARTLTLKEIAALQADVSRPGAEQPFVH